MKHQEEVPPEQDTELFFVADESEDLEEEFMSSILDISEWDLDDDGDTMMSCMEVTPLSSLSLEAIPSGTNPDLDNSGIGGELRADVKIDPMSHQLQRLTESMRRSEMSRAQVNHIRESIATRQRHEFDDLSLKTLSNAVKNGHQMDGQTLQSLSDWLNARIGQSRLQLQTLMGNMTYGALL